MSATNSQSGSASVLPSPSTKGRDCESQHRPRRIVQCRLRDDRLPHLRAQAHPLEERDEDGGISGGEDGPEGRPAGRSNASAATEPVTTAVQDHGDGQEAEADRDRTQHAEREAEPAVEEDHRDAERQEDLDADESSGRSTRRSRGAPTTRRADEHEHPRHAQDPRHEAETSPATSRRAMISMTSRADTSRILLRTMTVAPRRARGTIPWCSSSSSRPGFPQVMFFVTLAIALYLTVIERASSSLHRPGGGGRGGSRSSS